MPIVKMLTAPLQMLIAPLKMLTTPTVPSNPTGSTTHGSTNAVIIQHSEEECDTDRPESDDDGDDDDPEDGACCDDNDGQVVNDVSDDDMAVSMSDMYGEE